MPAAYVTSTFFELLGIAPRCAASTTDEPAGVVFARERYLRQAGYDYRCGTSLDIVIEGAHHRLAGVVPDQLRLPDPDTDLFIPFEPAERHGRDGAVFSMAIEPVFAIGRLRPSVSIREAAQHLASAVLLRGERSVHMTTLTQQQTRGVADSLLLLQTLAAFILVVTVVNVTQILVGQASRRAGEIAVRSSLGATLWTSHRPVLFEVTLVALGGLLFGGLVYHVTANLLSIFGPTVRGLPSGPRFGVRLGAIAVLAAGLCALVPSVIVLLRGRRIRVVPNVAAAGVGPRTGVSKYEIRLSQALVIGQASVTTAAVVIGALLLQSTAKLLSVDIGFKADRVHAAVIHSAHEDAADRLEALRRSLAHAGSLGLGQIALASPLPMTSTTTVQLQTAAGRSVLAHQTFVTSEFFRVLSIPVIEGRAFREHDDERGEPVLVVSRGFADRYHDGKALASGCRWAHGRGRSSESRVTCAHAACVRAARRRSMSTCRRR